MVKNILINQLNNPVEAYYDYNTSRFLRFDSHHATYGIHREVWGDEIKTPQEAFHFVNDLVLSLIKKHEFESILDLGCGVGGTLFYLAQAYAKPDYYGITLSSSQVQISHNIARKLDLQDRCTIIKGDFHHLPSSLPQIDLAFAIEAFVHATDSQSFFKEAAAKMNENGLLIICDDFLAKASEQLPINSPDYQLIESFRKGWILESLMSVNQIQNIAAKHGYQLIDSINLTPNLNLTKKRDFWISLFIPILKIFMKYSFYAKALVGGDAIQKCLKKGLIKYQFLVFKKQKLIDLN